MESPRTYRADAIILRRVNVGETDRIITLYTREKGKISAVAKGARKAMSKLAGATELLSYGRYFLAVGQNLDILTQAEIRESFLGIRRNLQSIAHATYLVELIGTLIEEHEANPNLFDTLLSALYVLEGDVDPQVVARHFELRVMSLMGYRPEMDLCVRCGVVADVKPAFSPSLGGLVCDNCGLLPNDVIHISADACDAMRKLLTTEPRMLREMRLSNAVKEELARAMRWYVRYRLDRDLKSPEFIQTLAADR